MEREYAKLLPYLVEELLDVVCLTHDEDGIGTEPHHAQRSVFFTELDELSVGILKHLGKVKEISNDGQWRWSIGQSRIDLLLIVTLTFAGTLGSERKLEERNDECTGKTKDGGVDRRLGEEVNLRHVVLDILKVPGVQLQM